MGFPLTNASSGLYWDADRRSWEQCIYKRLIIDGKFILLTPKAIVSAGNIFSETNYYNEAILDYLKSYHLSINSLLVQTTRDKKGNIIRSFVTKKSIKEDFSNQGVVINKNWITEFSNNHHKVYSQFKQRVKQQYSSIDTREFSNEQIPLLVDTMIDILKTIKEGKEGAEEYHDLIMGVCTLIFHPELSYPRKELEINDGRKRIDIVFSNRASKGIFSRLHSVLDIPCPSIIIECKNYSKEIANPELDQINGRFSAQRGKFGIIFCRRLDNEHHFVKRENDTYRDNRNVIIHITDEILIRLLVAYKENQSLSYDNIISKLVDDVISA